MTGSEGDGSGRMTFHSLCRPPLDAGHYVLEVGHKITQLDAAYKSGQEFVVGAPRFGLKPDDVYAVYPPEGQAGTFDNALPLIVFTRRTLPWETTLSGKARPEGDSCPWLALILLDAEDFAPRPIPKPVSRRLSEVVRPGEGVRGPKIVLEAHEHGDDLCLTLDLDLATFRKVVPAAEDLRYLAHVRQVETDDKETASYLADGWFSVVVANRLANPGAEGNRSGGESGGFENHAFLVSLLGIDDLLPGGREDTDRDPDDEPRGDTRTHPQNVRLVVLSSWKFRCREGLHFKDAVRRLTTGRFARPWSVKTSCGGAEDAEAERHVAEAHERGYVALDHRLRTQGRTVSWYRGPLLPFERIKADRYKGRLAADGALRYGPDHGMFDVSYAAAYQLGRLIALQDRHFAAAMNAFRTETQRRLNDALERRRVSAILGTGESTGATRHMRDFLFTLSQKPAAHGWDDEPETEEPTLRELGVRIPGTITQWLARLMLLYRVPFSYLVPEAEMLPRNSLRFFHLDPAWLKCLLEGACSVGRSSSQHAWIDEQLRGVFFDVAGLQAEGIRTRDPRPHPEHDTGLDAPANGARRWRRSGFLMRSPLVAGWQGLEMIAWDEAETLRPLRIDRLSPEVLLCIFGGDVTRIEIRQPPEVIHFGAAPLDAQKKVEPPDGFRWLPFGKTSVRRVKAEGAGQKPGETVSVDPPVCLVSRKDAGDRVVAIGRLAEALRVHVDDGLRGLKGPLSSAEFGVQMIESAATAPFRREAK